MSEASLDLALRETPPPRLSGSSLRAGPLSFRIAPRTVVANVTLTLVALALALWSISAGDFPIALSEVIDTLLGAGEDGQNFIVFGLRLPRAVTGILVGMAFGMSGAIFQSVTRNPLASPDIIGFNAGAALGAVTMIIVFGASGLLVALGALGGGIAVAALVFVLSWRDGVAPLRLVLVGIGIGFAAYAGVDFLLTRSDIFEAASAQVWLTGSLNARIWDHVMSTGIGVAVLMPLALVLQTAVDRLELGDGMAAAIGIRVDATRFAVLAIAVLLAAIAVAGAGPLAFVAFVAGPIARRLTESSGVGLVSAALVGANVVLAGDLAGRLVFAPTQLPVGVFTAVFGAPYLLWLLVSQIRRGEM